MESSVQAMNNEFMCQAESRVRWLEERCEGNRMSFRLSSYVLERKMDIADLY